MFKKISLLASIAIIFTSCNNSVSVFKKLDTEKEVKMYFISSEIMGPNTNESLHSMQKEHHSFYIDDPETIKNIKKNWVFDATNNIDQFFSNYYITYTEDGIYRGKVSLDLNNNMAISGYGASLFDNQVLLEHSDNFKALNHKFIEFTKLESARSFYKAIQNYNWLLPSENDEEFYIWSKYDGDCIIQVNNKQFARDKDVAKAFKSYMPKRFPDKDIHYNIFKFTNENSTIRICSMEDLSSKFPEDFHVIIPWTPFKSVILPLVNYNQEQLDKILSDIDSNDYRFIDKIE